MAALFKKKWSGYTTFKIEIQDAVWQIPVYPNPELPSQGKLSDKHHHLPSTNNNNNNSNNNNNNTNSSNNNNSNININAETRSDTHRNSTSTSLKKKHFSRITRKLKIQHIVFAVYPYTLHSEKYLEYAGFAGVSGEAWLGDGWRIVTSPKNKPPHPPPPQAPRPLKPPRPPPKRSRARFPPGPLRCCCACRLLAVGCWLVACCCCCCCCFWRCFWPCCWQWSFFFWRWGYKMVLLSPAGVGTDVVLVAVEPHISGPGKAGGIAGGW